MTTQSIFRAAFALVAFTFAFGVSSIASAQEPATTTTPTTVQFVIIKEFSGSQEGFTIDQFSFLIQGGGVNATVPHGGMIELEPGSYTIEEVIPSGFDLDDWTIQWSGDTCSDTDTDIGELVIDADDPEDYDGVQSQCSAINQYRPEDDDGGNGGNGTTTATLTVTKTVINDNSGSSTASAFSFLVNGASSTPFEADGTNVFTVPAGTYTITEVATSTYTPSYAGCSNITLAGGGAATCTITNNDNPPGGGGGGGDDKEYRIEGFVWHDEDEDTAFEDGEDKLSGWTVVIVNVNNENESQSTTTDSTGFYYFDVEEGTWRVSQSNLPEGWKQTTSGNDGSSYVITVPLEDEIVSLPFPLNLFVTVAHAAVVNTYSGYDFGNATDGNGGGGGNGGGDGGGSGGNREGGGGGSNRSTSISDDGGGEILGTQTEILPMGGANAGMGGLGRTDAAALMLLASIMLALAGAWLVRVKTA